MVQVFLFLMVWRVSMGWFNLYYIIYIILLNAKQTNKNPQSVEIQSRTKLVLNK